MRRIPFTLLLLVALAAPARAVPEVCPGCVLGLFADSALTQTQVEPSGATLDLYAGLVFGSGAAQDVHGVEFSITNLDSFFVQVTALRGPAIVLGTPAAPAGIDTLYHSGGLNVAWTDCLHGDGALLKLRLQPRSVWPAATVLRIKHRYPPTVQGATTPILSRCDDPYFTSEAVQSGLILLGPPGTPQCTVTAPQLDFGPVAEGTTPTLPFTVRNTGAGLLEGGVAIAGAGFTLDDGDLAFALAQNEAHTFTLRFTPVSGGLHTCTVSFTSGCDSLVFTASVAEVTPIATLYAEADSLSGSFAAIEGQVTIGASPFNPYTDAWVQDASGNGMHVLLGPLGNRECAVRGRIVHLAGTFERAPIGFQLSHITSARVLDPTNPEPVPLRLPIGEATVPAHYGAYVELFGTTTGGNFNNYWLVDGTGQIQVGYVPAGDGAVAVARGVVDVDLRGPRLRLYDLYADIPCRVRAVAAATAYGEVNDVADIGVRMGYNPDPTGSWSVELAFDPRVARVAGVVPSPLIAEWAQFEVVSTDSTVVVSASNPDPIPGHAAADLFTLRLRIAGCTPRGTDIRVTGLGGAIAALHTCDGRLVCRSCQSTGDVNGDLTVTPGDARCALVGFLHGGVVTPDCDVDGDCEISAGDVNCDFRTTPSDALEIFQRWLRGVWTNCLPKAGDAGPGADLEAGIVLRSPGSFRIDAAGARETGAGECALLLERLAPAGPAAVGADVRFDAARLRFVGLRKEPAGMQWSALEAEALGTGRVRVGGFDPRPETSAAPGRALVAEALARLVFQGDPSVLRQAQVEWLDQLAPGLETVRQFTVGTPRPNPVSAGSVALDFALPSRAQRVVATVLDMRGRRIKTLHNGAAEPGMHVLRWDRTDAQSHRVAAGLYVIVVRADANIQKRKIVVVN